MTTELQTMIEQLRALGFTDADQQKDFGSVIPYVVYLRRTHVGRFQYLSIVSYDGRLCEVVFDSLLAEKNTRKPKGGNRKESEQPGIVPDFSMLYRSLAELLVAIAKIPVAIAKAP